MHKLQLKKEKKAIRIDGLFCNNKMKRIIVIIVMAFLLCGCSYKKLDDSLHKKVNDIVENPTAIFEQEEILTLDEAESKARETHKDVEYTDSETGEKIIVTAPHRNEEGHHIKKGDYGKDPQCIFENVEYRLDSVTVYDTLNDSPISIEACFDNGILNEQTQNYPFILCDLTVKYGGEKETKEGIVSDVWLYTEVIENADAPDAEPVYFRSDLEKKSEHDGYRMPLFQKGDSCQITIGFVCPDLYISSKKIWLVLFGEDETEDVYFDLFE